MAIDYQHTAKEIVRLVGGRENIANVTHCATRLRFILNDTAKADREKVSKVPGVITVVEAGGQFQVVIGNHVKDAYRFVSELAELENKTELQQTNAPKVGFFSRIIDVISSIFAPFLYALAACGILQGILSVLTAVGWLSDTSGVYRILNFVSWTGFTFLPVLIAITAAKKFEVNPFIAVIAACALVHPDYNNMITAANLLGLNSADPAVQDLMRMAVENPDVSSLVSGVLGIPVSAPPLDFFGLPVQMLSYTSSVIPIILAIWVLSYIQRFFEKILPSVVRNILTPLFCIAIIVPLTLLVFGPVGSAIGGAIGGVYNYLYNLGPVIAGIFVGGLWEILVIFGVHWGITPVTVGNYATLGYDTFTALQAAAVFSQAGAALGVFLRTRDKEIKGVALPSAITAIFGITEPAIYGVNLRLKKPMICGCIAGAVGGAIAGAFRSVSWSYNMPGIATLPAFFKAGYTTQFFGLILSILVSFLLGAVLTYIVGVDSKKSLAPVGNAAGAENRDNGKESSVRSAIPSPVSGVAVDISKVNDEVFSKEVLGKGVGIQPADNILYAPFDGTVDNVFDTGHAIALRSDQGVELLIHIGVNTVQLNGEGFHSEVASGEHVTAGQPLISFDKERIAEKGYDVTTMVVVANTNDYSEIESEEKQVEVGEPIIHVKDAQDLVGERKV